MFKIIKNFLSYMFLLILGIFLSASFSQKIEPGAQEDAKKEPNYVQQDEKPEVAVIRQPIIFSVNDWEMPEHLPEQGFPLFYRASYVGGLSAAAFVVSDWREYSKEI